MKEKIKRLTFELSILIAGVLILPVAYLGATSFFLASIVRKSGLLQFEIAFAVFGVIGPMLVIYAEYKYATTFEIFKKPVQEAQIDS